jgi:glycosyltransferase involved in cell wall biosynthesis
MLRATRLIWQLSVLRRKGVKIVWTVHELNIPETRHHVIDRISVMLVASLSDAVIAHCHGARARIVKTVCPQAPGKVKVVPHGHLVDVTENGATREEARRSLGLDDSAFVVLFFGLIRPYKGVLDLVRAHKQLGLKEVTLLIVGSSVMHHKECVDYMEEIRRAIGSRENVKLIFEFIEDDRIQVVMGASDIVAFPYRDIMTSGALVMAMNFGKPCIAARVGCITETLDERGAYLYERGDQSGLVEVLRRAYLDRDRLPAMGEHNLRLARELPWQTIGQMTMGVYRECFSKRH